MKQTKEEKARAKRIQSGQVQRQDVARRLAELAFGRANDCVRLVLDGEAELDSLDLSLLREVKRNDKGAVEIQLVDRLKALEQLTALAQEENPGLDSLLQALRSEEG